MTAKSHKIEALAWVAIAMAAFIEPAAADTHHLSITPDPRGKFIRLCASFQVSRFEHPESVCACLWLAVLDNIEDPQMADAILFGVTERGVPNLDLPKSNSDSKQQLNEAYTAIAGPTMECFFGQAAVKKTVEPSAASSHLMPPVQDLAP